MNPLEVLREALDEAEHHQFGHDAMCRSMFATPGECNCAVQDYKDARAALDAVVVLVEAARFQIEVAPQGTTSRLAAALARFPATSPACSAGCEPPDVIALGCPIHDVGEQA